jgi:hypothetical protein
MFRVEPPPIVRGSDCTYGLGWNCSFIPTTIATGSSKVWQIPEAVCMVRALTMGGGSNQNMHRVIEINKMRKMTSCWLYLRNTHFNTYGSSESILKRPLISSCIQFWFVSLLNNWHFLQSHSFITYLYFVTLYYFIFDRLSSLCGSLLRQEVRGSERMIDSERE